MATTTNYSWTTPDDTDLVKDGAAAIRSLGTAIDSTVFTNAGAAINKSIVDAAGDLIYGTADNTVARLALGTASQILQVNSGATAPEWATPAPSGGMTLISTTSLTGSSVTISAISGSYKSLRLYFFDVQSTTDETNYSLRFNSDTGSNYGSAIWGIADANPTTPFRTTPSTSLRIGKTATQTNYIAGFGQFEIPEYASTSYRKLVSGSSVAFNNSYAYRLNAIGTWDNANAITSITILTTETAGTFSAGTALLYGVS